MSNHAPSEVLSEFVRMLNQTVTDYEETLIPVLRGSLLLRHWFGEKARPAGDIDLECFEGPRQPREGYEEEDSYHGGGHGFYGEYESLVDFGKGMCRYAANSTSDQYVGTPIEFFPLESSESDGHTLWAYGTPGERYFAGWAWHAETEQSGELQIDIAEPGVYDLKDISTEQLHILSSAGTPTACPAYSKEMMLASKLSWLLRSFHRKVTAGRVMAPEWTGEPKDLFDIHLLLTQSRLRPKEFQRCLIAVGAQDELQWDQLEAIFDIRHVKMTEGDFHNWEAFRKAHPDLVRQSPVEMLRIIADRLEPLLGDFYRAEEMPFIHAIQADRVDELHYLVYADWLEDRGDPRSTALRAFTAYYFHREELPLKERGKLTRSIDRILKKTSKPWLLQLLGTSARFQELQQMEADAD